jgi:hypothetical protein
MKKAFVFSAILFLALLPAVNGANITAIDITTNGNVAPYGGIWGTNGAAPIGVTSPTDGTGAFLDPGGVMSAPSGSYLLLFGWEDRFAYNTLPAGVMTADVTVYYSDSTSKEATFENNVMTSPSIWTRLSGDSSLVLGSSGIVDLDRVGEYTLTPNGVDDAILRFSDTGSFASAVPEPATCVLIGAGLALVALLKRKVA